MATYEQYKKKNGEKAWKFKTYLGKDPATGKQIQTTRRGFKTQKEAKIALMRLQADFETEKNSENKQKTYKDIYDVWLNEYEKTVEGSTMLKTKRIFQNHVLKELGDIYINKITPLMIQKIMDKWAAEYATASKMMNYAGLVFKYAIRFGYIKQNPVDSIRKPKSKKAKKDGISFYNKNQLQLFFFTLDSYPNIKARTFFRLLAMSGMRKQEVAALTWNDLNLRKHTIDINKAVTRTEKGLEIGKTKTIGSSRIISIDEKTVQSLIEWMIFQAPINSSILIFGNEDNKIMSLDTPRKWLVSIQDKMDEDTKKKHPRITTHGFRHTHVSLLVEMGATLKQIQDRLGHDDIQTTMDTYAHVSKSAREQLAEKFNDYIDF